MFDALPSEGAQQCTGGRWTLEEKLEHINGLQLKAGFLGLQSFCSNLSNAHIKIYLDIIHLLYRIFEPPGQHAPSVLR